MRKSAQHVKRSTDRAFLAASSFLYQKLVIQGRRFQYRTKARVRFPKCE